jgi:hypothetical protein
METDNDEIEIEREERAIYAIVIAAMLPVVVGLTLEGATIDGGGAISLLLVSLGVVGLVASVRALLGSRVPRARARFTRPR